MSWHMQRSVATSAGPGKGFSAMSSGGSSRIPISSASGSGQLFAAPPRFGSRSLVMDSKRRTASTTGNSRCGIVSSGSFGGSAQNISSLGIQQVTINQALLTPLNLNIDPSISVVRKEEREKIKTLNNKFASYIDKVRFLEQQNKVLETKWSLLQQQHQPSKSSDFDSIFNAYISSLTNGLGTLNRDKGTLDRHLQTMKEQAEDFKKRYEDELKTWDGAENAFVSVKKEVDATFLTNTQLQTRQCALEEELTFLRHIFEQVLSGIKQQGFESSVILSMDNNRVLDFNDTIADVKKQFEDIAKRSKDEAESAYQTKYRQLQDAASLQGDDLRKSKNEVSELSRSIQRLKNEIENLIKKFISLMSLLDAQRAMNY
ncbi:hypothetical protein GDO86_004478 [Hymenochirus boettgeri]|uniref:IF rod domain-containing protein n=1 Tax=Hymenochirus boettgeri TaxID=247094 RepID=A0A8T2K8X9_9PIPI|nr:hypothetical protein GDO86_004478 [Hymenochirus boettgeri]